jgi:F1F0 ATPase subunit 2
MGAGAFYFWGLWLTVQRLARGRRSGLRLIASFLVRASLSCAVFFLFMRVGLAHLLACMLGFFLVRLFWILRLKPGHQNSEPVRVHPQERAGGGKAG